MFSFRSLVAALVLSVPLVVPTSSSASNQLETIMWELVNTEETLENVEAFIENFPESVHIEEAEEIASRLRIKQDVFSMEATIFDMIGNVTYDAPLAFGDEHTIGRTLPQIMRSAPAFPPIEGLPDEVWKDKNCASCHQWTREALCTQASTYVDQDPNRYREKKHPFGGMLKVNLRNWAENGCG